MSTRRGTRARMSPPLLSFCLSTDADANTDSGPTMYSYFCSPNFDAFIEALPGTYETEADKKYPGINSGEYLVQRLASTYV